MKLLLVYIVLLNLWSYIVMGLDKNKARKHRARISEKSLWTSFLLGGALGGYIGMKQFKHKTKHTSFVYGLPIAILVNIACFSGVYYLLRFVLL
ncbi:DUF1294 domain-containing protein [Guptibacillus algicola]|uniref:DUF1294 domain-containing protein n=1 Tax=Guptibacillus algicola TaxID=225844 RepID=UPI001CD6689C|nr:DUF1294 domain-containing protein [Alkalihalobacillus algicola]MCA0986303.1 DUF1294 domain-containing protein [Alkalihalobacillus algicola]